MKHIVTLAFAALIAASATQAQTTDLVLFSEDGSKFTLVVDGDVKNPEPASRVVATGLRNESPVVLVRFADSSVPQMRKSLYLPLGMEYTVMITTNKKGELVFRPTGEAALGTAAPTVTEKPVPPSFVEDAPVKVAPTPVAPVGTDVTQTIDVGGVQQVTTVTIVEEEPMGDGLSEDINISMGMPGVGFDVKVRVDEKGMDMRTGGNTGTSGTSTTRTTTRTTTTTTTTGTPAPVAPAVPAAVVPAPVKEPEVYRMPGYSGPIGCGMPMTTTEFNDARKSIESKSFEDTKMTLAKQVGRDRCFTTDQVKSIMDLFSFEDSKLDFAKYAYERTHDIGNYFKLNDAFTFESSVDDLNQFLQAR